MNSVARTLTLCLSAGMLALVIPAHAELSAPQMKAAREAIATGKFPQPDLKLNCPSVDIPSALVRTQQELDKLSMQLKAKEACVQEIKTVTFEPNLRSRLETVYPKATGSQTSELTQLLVDAMAPLRSKVADDLRGTQIEAIKMGRPFVLRVNIEDAYKKEADKCDEPTAREWKTFVAAKMYLQGYDAFDRCIASLENKVGRIIPQKFVEQLFSSESESAQQYILAELPSIQADVVKTLQMRVVASRPERARAQRYIDAYKPEKQDE